MSIMVIYKYIINNNNNINIYQNEENNNVKIEKATIALPKIENNNYYLENNLKAGNIILLNKVQLIRKDTDNSLFGVITNIDNQLTLLNIERNECKLFLKLIAPFRTNMIGGDILLKVNEQVDCLHKKIDEFDIINDDIKPMTFTSNYINPVLNLLQNLKNVNNTFERVEIIKLEEEIVEKEEEEEEVVEKEEEEEEDEVKDINIFFSFMYMIIVILFWCFVIKNI